MKPLKTKEETPNLINSFLTTAETTLGTKHVWLISDNAGKYTSKKITGMLGDMDISHVTPQCPINWKKNVSPNASMAQ